MRISDWSSDVCSSDLSACLLRGIDASFDKTQILVEDRILDRDRQGEDAVQPSLDRRQLIDQLTFIFEAKPCPVAEITESDAGEFAAMQKPVPGQQRILGIGTSEGNGKEP